MIDLDISYLENLVGREFEGCWSLVTSAYAERHGVLLPDNPFEARQYFQRVTDPRPWDLIVIRNPTDRPGVRFDNHTGLVIRAPAFVHWMEGNQTTIGFTSRPPYDEPGYVSGYMRLRDDHPSSSAVTA